MNIFILDHDFNKCAEYHNDTHLSKMLLEACQLMCTAHHVTGADSDLIPYKKTHVNHPCSIWVRESVGNYLWTVEFARALLREYKFRFERSHGCTRIVEWCSDNLPKIENQGITKFAVAINNEKFPGCIVENDPVQSYRNYHKLYKRGYYRNGNFIEYKWTRRNKPEFML